MTRSRGLESAMDRVDRLHTSADEWVLSGWRAVVICDGLLRGLGCSSLAIYSAN